MACTSAVVTLPSVWVPAVPVAVPDVVNQVAKESTPDGLRFAWSVPSGFLIGTLPFI